MDIVVLIPNTDDAKRVLYQLSNLVKMAGVTNAVKVIHWTRVPLMSFTTVPDLGD